MAAAQKVIVVSGKSTLACAFEHALMDRGKLSYILDGDNLRHGLNNNLGFSAEDRTENIRRVGKIMSFHPTLYVYVIICNAYAPK